MTIYESWKVNFEGRVVVPQFVDNFDKAKYEQDIKINHTSSTSINFRNYTNTNSIPSMVEKDHKQLVQSNSNSNLDANTYYRTDSKRSGADINVNDKMRSTDLSCTLFASNLITLINDTIRDHHNTVQFRISI